MPTKLKGRQSSLFKTSCARLIYIYTCAKNNNQKVVNKFMTDHCDQPLSTY